jgi:transcriptional regulator with XRE-family HTH domain
MTQPSLHTLAARALRSARKAAQLTQLELSRALGAPENKISRWETGRAPLRSADAPRLLAAFKLAGRTEARQP